MSKKSPQCRPNPLFGIDIGEIFFKILLSKFAKLQEEINAISSKLTKTMVAAIIFSF